MRKDFIFHLGFRDPFGKELLKKYAEVVHSLLIHLYFQDL